MNDIDQKIQAALRHTPGGDELAGEPNLAEETLAAFRGRNRLLSALIIVVNTTFFVGAVWSALRFYRAETVPLQLQWAAVTFACLLAVTMVKLWCWLEIHTNRVLRELKRVELLLVTRPPAGPGRDATR